MSSKIGHLFNNIAPSYDFLNHLFSFNIDKRWRRKALKGHVSYKQKYVLDIACGTGDFAIQIHQHHAEKVIGVDISEGMLEVGRQKMEKKHLKKYIKLQYGDCANLEFSTDSFNAVTCAFGVRNFEQRPQSLREMYRVLKPGCEAIILEFSRPRNFFIKMIYHFYFFTLMPFVGHLVSGDKQAYHYLPESVYRFPEGNAFLNELRDAGFRKCSYKRLTFGIATIYYGKKI